MMSSLFHFISLPKPNIIKSSLVSSSSTLQTATTTTQYLEDTFGRKGIKFWESDNNVSFVDLTVRNGSTLRLNIPDAHVTSYKPKVYWKDDGLHEVLYTDTTNTKGGIGLVLNDASNGNSSLIPPSQWALKDSDSDAIDAVQVELSCSNGGLDINYVVSLYPLSMATSVIVRNNGRKAVTLTSAILSHMRFKKRGRSGIQLLKGSSYCSLPPLPSPFQIISPAEAMKPDSPPWFSFSPEPQEKAGSWSVQDSQVTILENKMSRVYAVPLSERSRPIYNTLPSKYETLDQGRGLFYRIIKIGFEDIYVSSPGSFYKNYGDEYFICTGPASMLVPIVIEPGQDWRGAQVIEHDNL